MFRSQHYQNGRLNWVQLEAAFELTNLRRQNATNKRLPPAEKCLPIRNTRNTNRAIIIRISTNNYQRVIGIQQGMTIYVYW